MNDELDQLLNAYDQSQSIGLVPKLTSPGIARKATDPDLVSLLDEYDVQQGTKSARNPETFLSPDKRSSLVGLLKEPAPPTDPGPTLSTSSTITGTTSEIKQPQSSSATIQPPTPQERVQAFMRGVAKDQVLNDNHPSKRGIAASNAVLGISKQVRGIVTPEQSRAAQENVATGVDRALGRDEFQSLFAKKNPDLSASQSVNFDAMYAEYQRQQGIWERADTIVSGKERIEARRAAKELPYSQAMELAGAVESLARTKGKDKYEKFATRLRGTIQRGLQEVADTAAEFVSENGLDEDQTRAYYAIIGAERRGDPLVDPKDGGFKTSLLGAAGMLPQMALVAEGAAIGGPAVGAAVAFSQEYPSTYRSMRDMGVNRNISWGAASISSALNAAIEMVEQVPFIPKPAKVALGKGIRNAALRVAKGYFKTLGKEWIVEEGLQAGVTATAQIVATEMDDNAKKLNIPEEYKNAIRQAWSAGGPIAILTAPGGVMRAVSEMTKARGGTPAPQASPGQMDAIFPQQEIAPPTGGQSSPAPDVPQNAPTTPTVKEQVVQASPPAKQTADAPQIADSPSGNNRTASRRLYEYERQRGYDKIVGKPERGQSRKGWRSKKNRQLIAAREADTRWKELKQDAAIEDRADAAVQARETRKANEALRTQAVTDAASGEVSKDIVKFAPLHTLPDEVRKTVQTEAELLLANTKSDRVKAALRKIIKDAGADKGADVENQKERITERLMGERDVRTQFERQIGVPDRPPEPVLSLFLENPEQRVQIVDKAIASIESGEPNELATAAQSQFEESQDHPLGAEPSEVIDYLRTLRGRSGDTANLLGEGVVNPEPQLGKQQSLGLDDTGGQSTKGWTRTDNGWLDAEGNFRADIDKKAEARIERELKESEGQMTLQDEIGRRKNVAPASPPPGKGVLLTPEGAKRFALANPESARAFMASDLASASDLENAVGISRSKGRWSQRERDKLKRLFSDALPEPYKAVADLVPPGDRQSPGEQNAGEFKENAATVAQRKADEDGGDAALGLGAAFVAAATAAVSAGPSTTTATAAAASAAFGIKQQKVRPDKIPEQMQAPREEVEDRMGRARGVPRESLKSKAIEIARAAWHKSTRAQEHIPNTPEFAMANEVIRLAKDVPDRVQDEVIRTVAAIIDPMGEKQLKLFERKIITDNMIASALRGEPLRFGFESLEELRAYQKKLNGLVSAVPEVLEALKTRDKVVAELVDKLVDADLLPKEAREHSSEYFHQQVLGYLQVERFNTHQKGVRSGKKSFQQRRVQGEELDEAFDYNTSYIEAETKWMAEAHAKLSAEKTLDQIRRKYDKMPSLKGKVKTKNFELLVGGPETVTRIKTLRAQLQSTRSESDDLRQLRRAWTEELQSLDPTYDARKKIAMGLSKLGKLQDTDEVDMRAIADLAENAPDDGTQIAARTVLKGISDRNKIVGESLGDQFVTWEDIVPDGHEAWQPEPGNVFYRALTIPDKIAEAIQKQQLNGMDLDPEQIKTVLAIGGKRPFMVLPTPIVEQFQSMETQKPSGALSRAVQAAMRGWKVWTLLSPKRAPQYMLRNVTGDIDPVIGGAPAVLKHVPKASRELRKYHTGRLAISENLRRARDLGVVSSSMTAQEIPNLKDMQVFERFYANGTPWTKLPTKAVEKYFQTVRGVNEFRENSLRYAAFLYYRDALRAGTLDHYGGAKKSVVDQLRADMGTDVAAAHLSRNLLGDYGNMTVTGQWLRTRLIPFWSWMEVNTKRYPRLVANAVEYGKAKGKGRVWATGVYGGAAMMSLGALYATQWAWNNLVQPEKERDLGTYDRQNPHVVMCRNPDGTVRIFRNVGAVGDFLETFGVNTLMSLYPQYAAGQINGDDLIAEMAKDPVNKFIGGLRPDLKAMFEVTAGVSFFPDAFNPRTQDRIEGLVNIVGMRDEYRELRGKLLKDGSRARPNYRQRFVVGVVDPRRNALYEIYDLRGKFLKREGRETPNFMGTSPFKNMREAVMADDYEAFKESRKVYRKSGKEYKNFLASLRFLDPIDARLNDKDEKRFEQDFLNSLQRKKLSVARNYAQHLRVQLWYWWNQAATEDGDTVEIDELRTSHRKTLRKKRRHRRNKESVDEYQSYLSDRRQKRKDAREGMKLLRGGGE